MDERLELLQGILSIESLLRKHQPRHVELYIPKFVNIYQLQLRFGVILSWKEAHNESQCKVELQKYIQGWYRKQNQKCEESKDQNSEDSKAKNIPVKLKDEKISDETISENESQECFSSVRQVSRLLGLPPSTGLQYCALEALRWGLDIYFMFIYFMYTFYLFYFFFW